MFYLQIDYFDKMIILILWILMSITTNDGSHFNGGTITWAPLFPSSNSSTVPITITQSYSWVYPNVACATSIPTSSSGTCLTCANNCSTEGAFTNTAISVLTDCYSWSASLGLVFSSRSVNFTLSTGNYFWAAFTGQAWRSLANAATNNSPSWSIVSLINLQRRPDGLINTPPVAQVASPQYVVVNTTTAIQISVSDVNTGDNIRCRWATNNGSSGVSECADVCTDGSTTTLANLSDCTLTFRSAVPGAWYAMALQVEDFMNTTSTTPMSSVPVQFLILVITPNCSQAPVFIPLTGCLDVQVNVPVTYTLYAMNYCNRTVSIITNLLPTVSITGMTVSSLVNSTTNTSLAYITLTWTPTASQIGSQEFCAVAYTSEKVQSDPYCVTFNVITSQPCATTTTSTTTTSTSTSTSTTSRTTTTSKTTSTSTTSKTTSTTSTSATTTTSTSTTTSTTSTTTSTTSTSTTTSSTSTTSSTTSTTSTTSSTTSTSATTTSTTSTTTSTTSTSTTTSSTSTTSSTTSTTSTTTSTTTSSTSTTSSTTSTTSTTTSTTTSSTSTTSSTTSTTSTTSSTTTSSTSTTSSTTSTTSTTTSTTTTSTTTSTSTSSTSTSTSTSTTSTSTTTSSTSATSSTTSTTSTTSSTTSTSATTTTTTSTTTSSTSTTTATTTTVTTATTATTTSVTTTTATTATTTTTTSHPNQINIPLIVGISLLALLLALGCCAFWLYYLKGSGLRRRRQLNLMKKTLPKGSDTSSAGKDLAISRSNKRLKNYMEDSESKSQDTMSSFVFNDSTQPTPALSLKNRKINRTNSIKVESVIQSSIGENILAKSAYPQRNFAEKPSKPPYSSVTISKVKKTLSTPQISKDDDLNKSATFQLEENSFSSTSTSKIQLIKMPKNKISASPKTRSNTISEPSDTQISNSSTNSTSSNAKSDSAGIQRIQHPSSSKIKDIRSPGQQRAKIFNHVTVSKVKPMNN